MSEKPVPDNSLPIPNLSPFINTLQAFLSELVTIPLHTFSLSQLGSSPTTCEGLCRKSLFFFFYIIWSSLGSPVSFIFLIGTLTPLSWLMPSASDTMAKKLGCRTCPPIVVMHWGQCLSCYLSQQWACVPSPGAPTAKTRILPVKTKHDDELIIAIIELLENAHFPFVFLA